MAIDYPSLAVNLGVFVATAAAAAVAWWQAIEASRARSDAREAEKAALKAWQDASSALIRANDLSSITMRAPYAYVLNEYGSAILSARLMGADSKRLIELTAERAHTLSEKSFAAGKHAENGITRWVRSYVRLVDLGTPRDPDRVLEATRVVGERIRLWQSDPDAAAELVRSDPLVDVDWN